MNSVSAIYRKYLIIIAIFFLCIATLFFLYHTSWRFKDDIRTLSRIKSEDFAIDLAKSNEIVNFKSGSLTLTGELFYKDNTPGKLGIILVHGSSPWGIKLPLYQILSKEFAKKGFVVFLFDLRGFGKSDDPVSLQSFSNVSDVEDVFSAFQYFCRQKIVDPNKVFLIGHSHGGGLAIKAAACGLGVQKVVSIGPPRRVKDRMNLEMEDFIQRYSNDRKLNTYMPNDIFQEFSNYSSLESSLPYYSSPSHKPIFLIDGELENKNDRHYLKDYFEKLSLPKKYYTLKKTGHYFNTLQLFGSRILIYDKNQIGHIVDTITTWLKE